MMPGTKSVRISVSEKAKQFESLSSGAEEAEASENHETANESDEDGIDFAELVRNITGDNPNDSIDKENEALQEAFKILDYDEDGFISVSDMVHALKDFDEEDDDDQPDPKEDEVDNDETTAKDMIAEADFDGDGKISFDDFLKVLRDDDAEDKRASEDTNNKKRKKKKKIK